MAKWVGVMAVWCGSTGRLLASTGLPMALQRVTVKDEVSSWLRLTRAQCSPEPSRARRARTYLRCLLGGEAVIESRTRKEQS